MQLYVLLLALENVCMFEAAPDDTLWTLLLPPPLPPLAMGGGGGGEAILTEVSILSIAWDGDITIETGTFFSFCATMKNAWTRVF